MNSYDDVNDFLKQAKSCIDMYDNSFYRATQRDTGVAELGELEHQLNARAEDLWLEKRGVRNMRARTEKEIRSIEHPNIIDRAARRVSSAARRMLHKPQVDLKERLEDLKMAKYELVQYEATLREGLEEIYSCRDRCSNVLKAYYDNEMAMHAMRN